MCRGEVLSIGVIVLASRLASIERAILDALFIPAFALVILAAAHADRRAKAGFTTRRWATYTGEASFAFYLLHELIIVNVYSVVGGASPLRALALSGFALGVCAVAAVALHEGVEKPAQRLIRDRCLTRRSRSQRADA